MEVKQTTHLRLTPPNLGSNLRLRHPRSGSLPHSTDQLGARLRDPMVGVACNLCQTARHSPSIATAIRTQLACAVRSVVLMSRASARAPASTLRTTGPGEEVHVAAREGWLCRYPTRGVGTEEVRVGLDKEHGQTRATSPIKFPPRFLHYGVCVMVNDLGTGLAYWHREESGKVVPMGLVTGGGRFSNLCPGWRGSHTLAGVAFADGPRAFETALACIGATE